LPSRLGGFPRWSGEFREQALCPEHEQNMDLSSAGYVAVDDPPVAPDDFAKRRITAFRNNPGALLPRCAAAPVRCCPGALLPRRTALVRDPLNPEP
jgi:hypothetical protein